MRLIKIVVVGSGGHAAVVIESLRARGDFVIVGAVDPDRTRSHVIGVPILGSDDHLATLRDEGVEAAVVALGSNQLRQKIAQALLALGYSLPPVVHPGASISPTAVIETGAVIMNRALVGTRARIGPMVIINTGCIVEHDNRIAAAAHVAPGVNLAGNVHIGERTLVGVGSTVRPDIRIGADVVIGAGSVVVADIPDGATVAGAPARPLIRRDKTIT
jgi:sugar O-acyltransferase (sialic acid O-acetyltransferase NeuD family)